MLSQSQSFRAPVHDPRSSPSTSAASPGDKVPAAQASRTADEATAKSLTFSIFGRSKVTGRSRLGGDNPSRQSLSAAISPSRAFSTTFASDCFRLAVKQGLDGHGGLVTRGLSGALAGFRFCRGQKGHPRCIFAVFSAGPWELMTASITRFILEQTVNRTSDLTRVHALVAAPPAEDNRRQNEKATLNASSRCRVSQQEAIVSSHTTTTAARHFCDAS